MKFRSRLASSISMADNLRGYTTCTRVAWYVNMQCICHSALNIIDKKVRNRMEIILNLNIIMDKKLIKIFYDLLGL